ncbi:transporter [Acinetobacter tianfuensis]|uniref:Transporter n=1 Tax=Acinetobacter tianfuensis TaxID=2419603 RepID=A0A3A8E3F9_9GAMM|nr:transporter [Acinetobacter tianfuensis]RKG29612.1 transporter [Acinetobacter tianfuensis]
MKAINTLTAAVFAGISTYTLAADFSFDRPGAGVGTGIAPVGKLVWEQGLPSASYFENKVDGKTVKTAVLNGDMLLRTGLAEGLELQLGWQGPFWSKTKIAGKNIENDGLGDVSIGLKKAIDLNDDKLSMAVLAEAIIATGNEEFSNEDDIYSLSSAVDYAYSDLIGTSISMRYEVQDGNWAMNIVPTLSYAIAGNLSGYSELVFRKAESEEKEYALATGLIYALNDRMQLDASVGVDLDGEHKGYTSGLGFSVLF